LISFSECIHLFPPDYRNNKEFQKRFKRWFVFKKKVRKEPLTLSMSKRISNHFAKYFTVDEAIYRMWNAYEKEWQGCHFANDITVEKGTRPTLNAKQKGSNGNGGNGNGKQPAPLPLVKIIIDNTEMQSPDVKRLNKAVQDTEAYLDKWAEYWYKQRKGKEWHECPNWSMPNYIPSAEQLYIKYIESMTWLNGDAPSEVLFERKHATFLKFQKQYQKRISGVNWETGGSL
jgi:hypothetical protein